MITPNSRIRLVKAPFEIDRINQLTFANQTAQTNYFLSLPYVEMDKATYQREGGRVRFNREYDEIIGYNYCMYQNTSYSNKWFYAFIEKIEYANDGVSFVYLKTDAFQTWQFQIQYKNTFVEREHVNDDTRGLHTIPEGLEHGEYVINVAGQIETDLESCYIVVGCTYLPDNTPGGINPTLYGGVYSGLNYCAFKNASNTTKFLKAMDNLAKADSIVEIFMVPKVLCMPVTWFTGDLGNQTGIEIGKIGATQGGIILRDDIVLNNSSTLNGYSPRNAKLFTYPYCVLTITNNAGTNAEYHYEDFVSNSPQFRLCGTICVGNSIKLYPKNYKKFTSTEAIKAGYDFGITAGKYPTCGWQSDVYTNWITQQAVNHQMAGLNFGLNVIGTASRGDVLGGVTSTVGQIGGMMSEYYQHALMPPQAKGTNSGDINFAMNTIGYTYYKMSIKQEYARIIDDYFSMFGYKVNIVKKPNVFGRRNWNYVKTIECNILGDIPQQDIIEIKNMFNNGVTFWHNPATFLDYSQNNPIV